MAWNVKTRRQLLLKFTYSLNYCIKHGKAYGGAEARAHIQKKYNYFKDRIKTTEEFITHAATKSTMSGKPYTVQCDGREIRCAEWLNVELERFRSR